MATEAKEKKSTAAKNFQPLGDRLFVTYTEEMERTSGGIYVPDSAKEKPQRGIVQADREEGRKHQGRRPGAVR